MVGEDLLSFKNDGELIKFCKKKYGRLPSNYEESSVLTKGILTRRHDSPQQTMFKDKLFMIELMKPLLRIVDNNIEEILSVPESEEELKTCDSEDWILIKYLLSMLMEKLAATEEARQLGEARYLAANPSLCIVAETTGSKRKIIDPNEVARADVKQKKMRIEALKAQKPYPSRGRGRGRGQRSPSNPSLGPDGTPWRGKSNRGRNSRGRGGRGSASASTEQEKA